jgi:hypothetical protein
MTSTRRCRRRFQEYRRMPRRRIWKDGINSRRYLSWVVVGPSLMVASAGTLIGHGSSDSLLLASVTLCLSSSITVWGCVWLSRPGIHAARHRLKRILTLIGLFPHWRALPRVRLTVMVGGRVRRSGRGLKMTCARRPCERATVGVRVVVHPNRWPREGPVRAGAPTSTGIVHPCLRPPAVRRLLAVPSGVGQRPRRRAERRQQQRLRRVCRGPPRRPWPANARRW